MALDSHIAELNHRHQALDREIEGEMQRPACDDLRIAELKKLKLRLKEEIEKLTIQRSAA
ncbi:MAG: DUF465 domain-containing protein [Parvibaculum sp.]|uniref:DUF465 domain-containing protein n=1 Tax=Parvibaculum sp. TaxID=2024848 RepID=UPI003C7574D1